MVVAAAGADGVFVEVAVSGGGFAGVHDAGAGALHRGHIAVGQGSDAAHPLHKVEGDALRLEDRGGRAGYAGDGVAGGQRGAVG